MSLFGPTHYRIYFTSCTFDLPQTFFVLQTNPGSVQTGVKTAYPDVHVPQYPGFWKNYFFGADTFDKNTIFGEKIRKTSACIKKSMCAY